MFIYPEKFQNDLFTVIIYIYFICITSLPGPLSPTGPPGAAYPLTPSFQPGMHVCVCVLYMRKED